MGVNRVLFRDAGLGLTERIQSDIRSVSVVAVNVFGLRARRRKSLDELGRCPLRSSTNVSWLLRTETGHRAPGRPDARKSVSAGTLMGPGLVTMDHIH